MTYWGFHAVFILPAIGVLLLFHWLAGGTRPPRVALGFGLIAGIALIYTAPWDQYLIAHGVWSYPAERVSESWRVGQLPLEECCFFILQPILTGLCLLCFLPRGFPWPARRGGGPARTIGVALALLTAGVGAVALAAGGRWLYLGLILVWGMPPVALHWAYGGDALWQLRRALGAGLATATVYLWIVDRAAIGLGIWTVSPRYATGWNLVGLPVEEALFFLVTNLLVVQGLLLYFHWMSQRGRPGASR